MSNLWIDTFRDVRDGPRPWRATVITLPEAHELHTTGRCSTAWTAHCAAQRWIRRRLAAAGEVPGWALIHFGPPRDLRRSR
jgi:hypothetical protein